MRIAWISNRDYDNPGGAEAADMDMIRHAPITDEAVRIVRPEDPYFYDLGDFDRIVVSTLRGLTAQQIGFLATLKPVIWVHDMEFTGHWIYQKARALITLTPPHRDLELENRPTLDSSKVHVNPGWFDTSMIQEFDKVPDSALWAHRIIWHKGLDLAQAWATQNDKFLSVLIGRPRQEVLRAMASSEYFVLLSHIFDPGPRAVIEAQLSGCKVVLDNVGFFQESQEDLFKIVDNAADSFWGVVVSA